VGFEAVKHDLMEREGEVRVKLREKGAELRLVQDELD
jgi:hypothetical protein